MKVDGIYMKELMIISKLFQLLPFYTLYYLLSDIIKLNKHDPTKL